MDLLGNLRDSGPLGVLQEFAERSDRMGRAAGIPGLSQAALLLAAVSGALGDRLGFEREGVRHAADFRLSTLSPQTEPPLWLTPFWKAVLNIATPWVVPPDRSGALPRFQTETRRHLAVLKAVGLDHTFDAQVLAHSLRIKPFPGGKLARTLGPPDTRGWHGDGSRPHGLVALGKEEIRSALRHGMPPLAFAWLPLRDWPRTARQAGPATVGRFGCLHELPRSLWAPDEAAWKEQALWFVDRLGNLRKHTVVEARVFTAAQPELRILEESERHLEALAATLPPCLRELAGADTLLGWRLTALLSAVCIKRLEFGREYPWPFFAFEAARLANWLAVRHFRHLRLAFPADAEGFFTAEETRVFRQLGDAPAACRDIQRKLAATPASACRHALARATRAGLAVEQPAGRWSLAPLEAFVGTLAPPEAHPAPSRR